MKGPLCDKQWEVIHYFNQEQPQHLILEGAVRSGKTYADMLLWYSHVFGFEPPGKDFILTGYTIGSIERNIIAPFSAILDKSITLDQFGRFDMGPHKVNCFGTDKENSFKPMQGMTAHGWFGNEVTTHHSNSIMEAFQRCSGAGFHIFWETNPDHPYHPIKIDHIDKSGLRHKDGQLKIKSFHFELEDNETLTPEYIENVKRTTPQGMWYDRRIKGLWVAAEGVIYEGFHRDIHGCDPFPIPDDWRRVRGIDFGTVHPFVMLWGAVDPDGRLYIYREYYKTNTLIENHVKAIQEIQAPDMRNETEKSRQRYMWTVADHDAQERLEWEAKQEYTKPANKAVKLGIELTATRMLVRVDKLPRVRIFNTCTELMRQLGIYRWPPYEEGKPYKEEPLKIDDDGPDVLRYMITELDFSSAPTIKPGFRGYKPRR